MPLQGHIRGIISFWEVRFYNTLKTLYACPSIPVFVSHMLNVNCTVKLLPVSGRQKSSRLMSFYLREEKQNVMRRISTLSEIDLYCIGMTRTSQGVAVIHNVAGTNVPFITHSDEDNMSTETKTQDQEDHHRWRLTVSFRVYCNPAVIYDGLRVWHLRYLQQPHYLPQPHSNMFFRRAAYHAYNRSAHHLARYYSPRNTQFQRNAETMQSLELFIFDISQFEHRLSNIYSALLRQRHGRIFGDQAEETQVQVISDSLLFFLVEHIIETLSEAYLQNNAGSHSQRDNI